MTEFKVDLEPAALVELLELLEEKMKEYDK